MIVQGGDSETTLEGDGDAMLESPPVASRFCLCLERGVTKELLRSIFGTVCSSIWRGGLSWWYTEETRAMFSTSG